MAFGLWSLGLVLEFEFHSRELRHHQALTGDTSISQLRKRMLLCQDTTRL
jgi:hypothetical protein